MKIGNIFKNPLFYIFLLSLIIRTYKLDQLPSGFHVDEVKVAWNALSILTTGADDHGDRFSLYYNSFGDYRPTGIFYIVIPFLILLGKSIFATRLPIALFGALSIFPVYFLIEILARGKKFRIFNLRPSHIGALLLSLSSWHIDLSRATNEVIPSSFFALTSLYIFIQILQKPTLKKVIICSASLILSFLLYHPIRFLAVPFFLTCFFTYPGKNKSTNKFTFSAIIIGLLISAFFSLTPEGRARFNQVSVFNDVDTLYQIDRIAKENKSHNLLTLVYDNKLVTFTKSFINQWSEYFAGNFLIGESARPFRFATPGTGLLTYVELLIFIIGLGSIINKKQLFLPLILLLIAPIPAAITSEDIPNMSRAFFMLPFIIIIEAYGVMTFLSYSKKHKSRMAIVLFILLLANFSYFGHMYLHHSISHRPFMKNYFTDSPSFRNTGAIELAKKIESQKSNYDYIIITNFPDNPYPWYAFFNQKDPSVFNKTFNRGVNTRIYENIIFSEEKCPSEKSLEKYLKKDILMVDSWECPFENQINSGYPLKKIDTINRPDGSNVYTFLVRDKTKPLYINSVAY